MSDITVTFKNETILTMDASGSKPLLTRGKYCEDDISISYVKPSGGADTLGALLDNTLTSFSHSGNVTLTSNLFQNKTGLRSVSLPDVTALPASCFDGCINIESFDFSSLATLGPAGMENFGSESSLNVIHLPNLVTVSGSYAFGYLGRSTHLMTLVLPKLSSMGADMVRGSFLDAVDFGPDVAQLNSRTFYGTSRYNNVILRRTAGVVTCSNINALSNLDANTTVWVPAALLSQYQSETSWSTKTSITWATIEGSIYENAYADGTPIT